MNLKGALDNYYYHSGKASDIVRQLALGAIAIIWLFQTTDGGARVLPAALFLPLKLIVGALAADLLQYVVAGFLWGAFHRSKEKKLGENDAFKAPRTINWPAILFYYDKVALVVLAYWHLWRFLSQAIRAGV
ncbi:hypothetical protein ABQY74_020375 [Xanthomonas sp. WHRI 7064]|uniref:hypothetical protein n=1 Tax=Xanthomonas sp. WHRI 7064 TaxID=3161568 RepID=UPI0032E933B0